MVRRMISLRRRGAACRWGIAFSLFVGLIVLSPVSVLAFSGFLPVASADRIAPEPSTTAVDGLLADLAARGAGQGGSVKLYRMAAVAEVVKSASSLLDGSPAAGSGGNGWFGPFGHDPHGTTGSALLKYVEVQPGPVLGDFTQPVPEPTTLILLGGGLVGLATLRKLRRI